jgi:hypothetical protein
MSKNYKPTDQYSDEEAQRRFVAAVKAGLNTKPMPLKSMTPKGVPAQSKKRQTATRHPKGPTQAG